jgi:DNA polymerase-1
VVAKFGVRPGQIVDLLALMGDSSDNVPGVPKVGEKTATGLLQQFGSLDEVLAHAAEVKQPAIRQSLQEHRADAELSRRLVTLHTDVPLPVGIGDLGPARPDRDALDALFAELEFDSLRASLPRPQAPKLAKHYTIVRSDQQLDEMLAKLRAAGRFAVDTETTSIDPRRTRLVGVSFSFAAGEAFYVPFNLEPPLAGGHEGLVGKLKPLLEDQKLKKTGQNAKFDMGVFRSAGIAEAGLEFDTMLASYCLSPGQGSHGLDALALR